MAPTGCWRTVSGSLSPPCSGYFSPFPHGTGSLSVLWKYLALRGGPRGFRQDFTCPALLRIPLSFAELTCTGLSPSTAPLSSGLQFVDKIMSWSYNPGCAVTLPVWAVSVSLAATQEIEFSFSSSAYLDVSVQRVCSLLTQSDCPSDSRVAPFGNHRINSFLQIPGAYRSLTRPSSPP